MIQQTTTAKIRNSFAVILQQLCSVAATSFAVALQQLCSSAATALQ
ncbi:hypothetical protein HU824_05540 [Bacteroides sp. L10-4]|nr:hypothetical protein [Bacteroides sp. L10-4]NVK92679.1 hypothetical protein [Bacteroides sp. L10-4]